MPHLHTRISFLTGLVMAVAAGPSFAEPVQAKAGLWAFAAKRTINGNVMPTNLDIKGGMSAQEKQAIQQAMRQLGLPAGWDPRLSCAKTSTYDAVAIAKAGTPDGCTAEVLEQRRDGVKFKLACQRADMMATGHGEIAVSNGAEMKSSYKVDGKFRGQAYNYDSQEIGKWLGADCANPPAGIDPQWLSQDDEQ